MNQTQKRRKLMTADVGTNTDKQLKDYKIFVFDLDETLFLKKVDPVFADDYHKKVQSFLTFLKENNKLLYIATHNSFPNGALNFLGINSILDGVIKETRDVNPVANDIEDYTDKKDMILEILDNHKDLSTEDVVFFDDNDYNIKKVENINVKCVYIDNTVGIKFSDIY